MEEVERRPRTLREEATSEIAACEDHIAKLRNAIKDLKKELKKQDCPASAYIAQVLRRLKQERER